MIVMGFDDLVAGLRVQAPEMLPGHKTPLEGRGRAVPLQVYPVGTVWHAGFHMCGDSTAPGIGVPAVVMSGHICANNIMSVPEHWQILAGASEHEMRTGANIWM